MSAVLGRRARLRWLHLLLGAALLTPFQLLTTTIIDAARLAGTGPSAPLLVQLLGLAMAVPLVAAAGLLLPVLRTLEGGAVRTLGGLRPADAALVRAEPAAGWPARRRTSVWFTVHAVLGGCVAGASLASPPAALGLLLMPWWPAVGRLPWATPAAGRPVVAVAGALLLVAVPVVMSWAAGTLLARLAPALLGPTPADRLAAAERRAARLAERNRLAGELHDAVGHALSAVTIQAGAARTVLGSDPEFAERALGAIEETARSAVAELDRVLGLLREERDGGEAAGPGLEAVPELVARMRAAGASVACALPDGPLPDAVSREAYRIVQEGLGNALRHAGAGAPVAVRVAAEDGEVAVEVRNGPGAGPGSEPRRGPGAGRGLPGVRERAARLGGAVEAGPDGDGGWRLAVRLPLDGGERNGSGERDGRGRP
ncbi:hypothetical protein BIV57_06985 [Mangrovactinospora gilvigrisea]|uniref:histidine kinase n=1 Tax=Mangrovactinospora gilvigrisea TaxID=1428644 RepID=A0A1J7BHT2_9ACTN|nr:hypothetical protein BIV57_06985 [Mangrovactinospora gilvigrisea]